MHAKFRPLDRSMVRGCCSRWAGEGSRAPFAEKPNPERSGRKARIVLWYGQSWKPLQLPSRGLRLIAAEGSEETESDVRAVCCGMLDVQQVG